MGSRYRHFSIEERCEIARRSEAGQSLRQIAAALDRSASSVARELKRNTGAIGYRPTYAGEQAHARRWKGSKLLRKPDLQALVLKLLERGLSPEAVAGRLALEQGKAIISHERRSTGSSTLRSRAPRTTPGGDTCPGARPSAATAAARAAAQLCTSPTECLSPSAPHSSRTAPTPAIGKPIRCNSPNTARPC